MWKTSNFAVFTPISANFSKWKTCERAVKCFTAHQRFTPFDKKGEKQEVLFGRKTWKENEVPKTPTFRRCGKSGK